jgi:hypothetical protein
MGQNIIITGLVITAAIMAYKYGEKLGTEKLSLGPWGSTFTGAAGATIVAGIASVALK